MNRIPVKSSNLRSVGFDPNVKILEIEFTNGGVYEYYNVPESVYRELMAASSHGKYFHANISKVFNYRKIK